MTSTLVIRTLTGAKPLALLFCFLPRWRCEHVSPCPCAGVVSSRTRDVLPRDPWGTHKQACSISTLPAVAGSHSQGATRNQTGSFAHTRPPTGRRERSSLDHNYQTKPKQTAVGRSRVMTSSSTQDKSDSPQDDYVTEQGGRLVQRYETPAH